MWPSANSWVISRVNLESTLDFFLKEENQREYLLNLMPFIQNGGNVNPKIWMMVKYSNYILTKTVMLTLFSSHNYSIILKNLIINVLFRLLLFSFFPNATFLGQTTISYYWHKYPLLDVALSSVPFFSVNTRSKTL